MIELNGKYNRDCKVFIDNIESEAYSLIQAILDQPVSAGVPIRIMPDTHAGKGIVIGFTMPLTNMIKSEWVGVDIGCGMISGRFNHLNESDLENIDKRIRESIPMGFNVRDENPMEIIPFGYVQASADHFIKKFNAKFSTSYEAPIYNSKWLSNKLKDIKIDEGKFFKSIGTLGGGNHFIEIGKDNENKYWVTVHSGSRNFGLKIANYWTNVARGKVVKKPKEYDVEFNDIVQNTVPKSDIPKKLEKLKRKYSLGVDKEYLQGDDLIGYLFDMIFAQMYAVWNRRIMLNDIEKALGINGFEETVSSTHNYIDFNDFVIRKGAISAYKDQKVIIPWNMRDGLVIAEGRGNEDWNFSAPHGAGRIYSRTKAKELIDLDDFKNTMDGIYSSSVCESTIDESPFAYKDSELIEMLIEPTVKIIHKVKPILNIKDTSK